ncbi:MFS transporter [Geodermatophilus chilensis]|uniref:MFS transporter n=1 Tax=Geodermatophilus chilensis TaxID=2035835 RepID=UPI001E350E21|nr:MFS transporter [Geodermatophilus chilensis]
MTVARSPRALVPVLVFVGTVVAVISSLGAPLVPAVAETMRTTLPDAQWSLTATLLVGAVATPVVGRLGDGPHRRRVVLAVLAVVTLGGVLAALPLGLGWLIAGRTLQGVGLGLTPLAMATAREALEGDRSRSTIAVLSVTVVTQRPARPGSLLDISRCLVLAVGHAVAPKGRSRRKRPQTCAYGPCPSRTPT